MTAGVASIAISLPSDQTETTINLSGTDGVGNALVDVNGDQGQTAVRTDVVAPTITSDNLDSTSCLNIASDADSTTGGLQFTPQLTVSAGNGEITTTTVLVDGTPFVAGAAS